MIHVNGMKRALAILLVVLFATPVFGIASFADAVMPGFVKLNTVTDTLNEGDHWYNSKGLAALKNKPVYQSDSTYYLSDNEQVIRIVFMQDGSKEERYKDSHPEYFTFLMTMPAFGDPLPTSPDGLSDGDYWFDKEGLWAAVSPQMNESERAQYMDASYYLSEDGTILRKTFVFESGSMINTDELVLDDPDTMCNFLRQVGVEPNAGFVLLPKSDEGLEIGDYWFDADALARTIGGDFEVYYKNADYYLSEDGETLRIILLGKSTDSFKSEHGYYFNYLHQVGIDPNAGFTKLPISDSGLDDGEYWYDAASRAASNDNDEPLSALYYLSEDGNTLRVIIAGIVNDTRRDSELADADFRYLRQVGVDPNVGFTLLPTSKNGLANGAYWFDAAGLNEIFGSRYENAQYYLNADASILRIIVDGVMTDRTDRTAHAAYFRYLRKVGDDTNTGYLRVYYSVSEIPCRGFHFNVDAYLNDQIQIYNEDRIRNGKAPFTAEEEAAKRTELRDAMNATEMYCTANKSALRINEDGIFVTYRRGDEDYDEYVQYLTLYESANHAYNDGVVTEATCEAGGFTLFTCTRCGDYYKTNETPALGHNFNENAIVTKPTCTEGGYTTQYCTRCGKTNTVNPTKALGHAWNSGVVTTDPSCGVAGEKTFTCTRCGETRTEPVDALEHEYEVVVTQPTCTQGGITTYTCKHCGDSYTMNPTAALNHNWNNGVVTTEPKCGVEGVKTFTCLRCQETRTEPVDALEHEYEAVVTQPTCTEGGFTTYTCKHCGDSYTANETGALDHTFVGATWVSADESRHKRACTRCGEAFDYADHAVVTNPTCTADGSITYTCKVCGYSYTAAGDPAIEHTYGAWQYKDENCHERFCTVCTTPDPVTEAHDYEEDTSAYVAPTEDTEGKRVFVCKGCGHVKNETIETIGHDWDDGVYTEPTCTADGYTTYTCKNNPEHTRIVVDENSRLGHDFGAWTVTTQPTCTAAGEQKKTCSRCTAFETQPVEARGHDYQAVVTNPTCTEGGYTTYTCSRCQDSYTANETAKLGHSYQAVVTNPTCTEGGYTTYTCSRCQNSYTGNETEKLGHSYQAAVTQPTCTAGGYTTYTCTRCRDTYSGDETAALGHSFGAWTQTKAPTENTEGEETRTCSRCNAKETRAIPRVQKLVIVTKPDAPIRYVPKKPSFTLKASETVTWSSSNDRAVKVDPTTGALTTVKRGSATITATSADGRTATCEVTVKYVWWQWLIIIFLFGWIWY